MGRPRSTTPSLRARRSAWATAAYMLGFAILIAIVSVYFLLPGLDAAREADRTGRQQLSAVSALLLCVVLFICLMGLLLIFRFGRFFFPRQDVAKKQKTEYIDAWAESGRRLKTAPPDDEVDDPADES